MSEPDEIVGRPAMGPASLVGDKYRLVERLGAGGMGTVWRATHKSLGHDVAVKFLEGASDSPDARARFDREARIAARLGDASLHIARVIDHGVLGNTPYLVMEMLQGETLSARLKREKRLSLQLAAKLVMQLCRALQVAHGAGVIHRDIKPGNVFLCRSEFGDGVVVKLMDFGVAKSTRESEDETTRAGTVIGTPGYMSPEQILCKKLDARSDLWGLAATVYRMVVGRSPYGAGGMAELGLRILATDPIPPSTLVPELPAEFDRWVAKALAKNPEDRFQSARDFADSFAMVAGLATLEPSGLLVMPLPEQLQPRLADGHDSDPASAVSGHAIALEPSTRRERPTSAESAPERTTALPLARTRIAVAATIAVLASVTTAALVVSRGGHDARAGSIEPTVVATARPTLPAIDTAAVASPAIPAATIAPSPPPTASASEATVDAPAPSSVAAPSTAKAIPASAKAPTGIASAPAVVKSDGAKKPPAKGDLSKKASSLWNKKNEL